MKQTSSKQSPLIILTAGGTGGHVYPAEALAEELGKRGFRLLLVTDSRGLNNYKGKLSEIPNAAVLSGAIMGKSKWFKIKSLFKTCIGVLQAAFIIIRNNPVAIVGFGGYASFPACMAAILLGKNLIIHEQNSVMSRTNRFLAKYATLIAESFAGTRHLPEDVKTKLTGMPVRKSIAALYGRDYPELKDGGVFKILILGGSQGAKIFSDVIPESLAGLDNKIKERLEIYQQCRKDDVEFVAQTYKKAKIKFEAAAFFGNMDELYNNVHLVISRSGASSVSEIAAAGVPSLLIPLPTAADDHQSSNAEGLQKGGGAIVIRQDNFTNSKLQEIILHFINNPGKLSAMSAGAFKKGIPDAAARLADNVEKVISRSK